MKPEDLTPASSMVSPLSGLALPPLYPITDCTITGFSHLEMVERLIAGGATLIQLRDKTSESRTFYEATCQVMAYARPRGVRILVNDRVDIALAAAADGVHLGQEDLPPHIARTILGPQAIIGYSTHSMEQAVAANTFPVDYIAIGPVFATQTKLNPSPVVGLELVAQASVQIAKPLVAIGGITLSHAVQVLRAGAASVAIISDLLNPPETMTQRLRGFLSTQ